MFNDHLSDEMAKERIHERIKEVETYSLHQRLGYRDSGAKWWAFILIVVLAVVALSLLL
jgi:hypothetical protein